MLVSDLIKEKGAGVITTKPATTVSEVADIIASKRIGALVVTDLDDKVVGLLEAFFELAAEGVPSHQIEPKASLMDWSMILASFGQCLAKAGDVIPMSTATTMKSCFMDFSSL